MKNEKALHETVSPRGLTEGASLVAPPRPPRSSPKDSSHLLVDKLRITFLPSGPCLPGEGRGPGVGADSWIPRTTPRYDRKPWEMSTKRCNESLWSSRGETGLVRAMSFGFSLLELMVVVVLIGVLSVIAIPTIRSLSGLDLKNQITKIAGLASEVYDLAAMSGKTHRIVFDLDNGSYWVEEKEGDAGELKPELGYEDIINARLLHEKQEDTDKVDEFVPQFKPVSGPLGEKFELPKDMAIYGAWTDQMTDVARSGLVSFYFFSGGYTQTCFVSLAVKGDEEKTAIYMALSPLTGAVSINLGEPDTKDLLAPEGDKS